MLGCRVASTPIDQNHKLCARSGDLVNRESYQRLVVWLLYLCHTRPYISYVVSVVSRYMYDPRSGHLDVVYRILRCLKGSLGKGLCFRKNGHMKTRLAVLMTEDQPRDIVFLLEETWCHGREKTVSCVKINRGSGVKLLRKGPLNVW